MGSKVVVAGTLGATSPLDVYPIVEDTDVKGGFRTVADEAARLAIPVERRSVGMEVKQTSNNVTYELYGGLDNVNWRVKPGGGNIEERSTVPTANTIPLRDVNGKFPLKVTAGSILVGGNQDIAQEVPFPSSTTGEGGKVLMVRPDGNGYTLGTSSGGDSTWNNIQDKPNWTGFMPTTPLAGKEGMALSVKQDGSGYEYKAIEIPTSVSRINQPPVPIENGTITTVN